MAIEVRCASCDVSLSVAEKHAGKKGKCPKCGNMIQIPTQCAQAAPSLSRPVASLSGGSPRHVETDAGERDNITKHAPNRDPVPVPKSGTLGSPEQADAVDRPLFHMLGSWRFFVLRPSSIDIYPNRILCGGKLSIPLESILSAELAGVGKSIGIRIRYVDPKDGATKRIRISPGSYWKREATAELFLDSLHPLLNAQGNPRPAAATSVGGMRQQAEQRILRGGNGTSYTGAFPLKKNSVLLLLLLTALTLGLYESLWYVRQKKPVNALSGWRNLGIGPVSLLVLNIIDIALVLTGHTLEHPLGTVLWCVVWSLSIELSFKIRRAVLRHAKANEMLTVRISPILTFLFRAYYLQYKINRFSEGRVF